MNEKMNFDSQMLFIFLAISLLVFYKFMITKKKINNMNNINNNYNNYKEGFQDFNDFAEGGSSIVLPSNSGGVQGSNSSSVSIERINELTEKVAELQLQIQQQNLSPENIDLEQLKLSEQIQNAKLNMSQQQLNNLENQLNRQMNQEDEYKKIPVYNSCILNASGELENTNQTTTTGAQATTTGAQARREGEGSNAKGDTSTSNRGSNEDNQGPPTGRGVPTEGEPKQFGNNSLGFPRNFKIKIT